MAGNNVSQTCYVNILVPTDGSEVAWEASKHAVYLARLCGSNLHAIYVIEGGKAFKAGIHYRDTYKDLFSEGKKAVEKVKKLAKKEGVECITKVLDGDPAKVIINYASEYKCDLIVIGSIGIGAIEKVLVGSVTSTVVGRAKSSVHVVRPYTQ